MITMWQHFKSNNKLYLWWVIFLLHLLCTAAGIWTKYRFAWSVSSPVVVLALYAIFLSVAIGISECFGYVAQHQLNFKQFISSFALLMFVLVLIVLTLILPSHIAFQVGAAGAYTGAILSLEWGLYQSML